MKEQNLNNVFFRGFAKVFSQIFHLHLNAFIYVMML